MEKLKPYGHVGITETECMMESKCCYDLHTDVGDGQHCFKPAKPGSAVTPSGMSLGTMIGISIGAGLGVVAIGAIIMIMLTKCGNSQPRKKPAPKKYDHMNLT